MSAIPGVTSPAGSLREERPGGKRLSRRRRSGDGPSPNEAPLETRLQQIMIGRLGQGALPIALVQVLSSILNVLQHNPVTAASSLLSSAAWLAVGILIRRQRIDDRWAALLTCLLWQQIHLCTLYSYYEMEPSLPTLWLAISMIGYASVQLDRRYFWWPLAGATLVWLAVLALRSPPNVELHLVSVSFAVALALLAFRSNHVLIRYLEQLKGAEYRRSIELAEALALAERELQERRQAELEREKLREQFIQSQRLEAIGSLAGGLAHDMNNVLASIGTVTRLIAKDSDGRHSADFAVVLEACERGATLTGSLLGFSRRAQYRKEQFELNTAVDDALRLLGRTLRKDVRLVSEVSQQSVWVEADRSHLVQVLVNLCINSERAITGKGTIRVATGIRNFDSVQAAGYELAPGDYITLTVSDDGCGMAPEVLRRAFEPFFTTRQVGEGSGLGLAMVYGTLRAHGGGVQIESWPGIGTRVTCLLPQLESIPKTVASDSGTNADIGRADTRTRPRRILLADDERLVRYAITRSLQEAGYEVVPAEDGQEALDQFIADQRSFDAVVLDMSMPRMNGAECYRRLREIAPDLPIICVSGYPLDSSGGQLMGRELLTLQKPFQTDRLLELLSRVLERNLQH